MSRRNATPYADAAEATPEEIVTRWNSSISRKYAHADSTFRYGGGCRQPLLGPMQQWYDDHVAGYETDHREKHVEIGRRKMSRNSARRRLLKRIEDYLIEERGKDPEDAEETALAALGYHLSDR